MLYTYLLPLALVLVVLYLVWDWKDKRQRNIKGPFSLPFVGGLPVSLFFTYFRKGREDFFNYIFPTFGHTVLFRGFVPVIITKDPENIKWITTTNFANYKRNLAGMEKIAPWGKKLFGNGIFAADGDIWEIQRKLATPLFKKHSLDEMKKIFVKKSNEVLELTSQYAKTAEFFDIQQLFFKYTLDSFAEIGFGMEVDSLHKELKFPFHFDRAQKQLISLATNPFERYFGNMQSEFYESVKFIHSYFSDIIDHHEPGVDLLSSFIALRDENGKPYPKQWLIDIVVNFAVAGRDTTALLLTWTTYCLLSNPRVEEKLRKEIARVIGDGEPDDENIVRMGYLDNILKETLRLYPSVPNTPRWAEKDDVLPSGVKVKAGDRISYNQYFLHRDPKYWDNPLEFSPERWDNPKLMKHPHQYLPFHAGPMQCLGRHMALIEAKILIVRLFMKFKFELDPNHVVEPFLGIVLPAKNGVKVTTKQI